MKKVLLWISSPIWVPVGLCLAVIALAICLILAIILMCLPIASLYLIGFGLVSCFSGLIWIFSHFFSFSYFFALGILSINVGIIIWRAVLTMFRKVYSKKNKDKPIKIKKSIVTIAVCIALMVLSLLCGGKNAFYWTKSGPTLSHSISKIYSFHPTIQNNLAINAENVNVNIVNGDTFSIAYYGDDTPQVTTIDSTIEINVSNSHPNNVYSITSFPANNNLLLINIPNSFPYGTVTINASSSPINIDSLVASSTNITSTDKNVKISYLSSNKVNITNENGNVNLNFAAITGDSSVTAPTIYANFFEQPHYSYNITASNITFNGQSQTSPYSFVNANQFAISGINLSGTNVTVDLSGQFMSAEDFDNYTYIKNLEDQINSQQTATPTP